MEKMDHILPIIPAKEGKNGHWKGIKNRRTRFKNKILSISGINEDLLGPYQPERLSEETHEDSHGKR